MAGGQAAASAECGCAYRKLVDLDDFSAHSTPLTIPFTMAIKPLMPSATRPHCRPPTARSFLIGWHAITILRVTLDPKGCDAGVFFSIRTMTAARTGRRRDPSAPPAWRTLW